MGPDSDRWIDAEDNNHVPMEMPPLEDAISLPVLPVERVTVGVYMEEPDGLQVEFIRQILSDQTTDCTLIQRFSQLLIDS